MSFALQILGANSAIPNRNRYPSAQVLTVQNDKLLIDCGEGTQIRIQEQSIRTKNLRYIFISHLHGDHVFGLPGLLSTFNLLGRQQKITLIGPPNITSYLQGIFDSTSISLNYELEIKEWKEGVHEKILDTEKWELWTLPLRHRVPTSGCLVREKELDRNIRPEKIAEYQLSIDEIKAIKNGADYKSDKGQIIPNEELTYVAQPVRSYAYCSDTIYSEELVPWLSGINLLYHEATYLEASQEQALERGHSTALEAARIAHKADVGHLILGHFSSRYAQLDDFQREAEEVFPSVSIAETGQEYRIEGQQTIVIS